MDRTSGEGRCHRSSGPKPLDIRSSGDARTAGTRLARRIACDRTPRVRSARRGGRTIRGIALGAGLAVGLLGPATVALAGPSPQRTVRVRLAQTGNPNGPSGEPSLSADARVVAFSSVATNLASDGNGELRDVFLYDQASGAVQLISVGPGGLAANARSGQPVLSGDGRRVAFASRASNLVFDDGNAAADVFAFDPEGGLVRASAATGGAEADGASAEPDLSADGSVLVFTSRATNLVPGDDNGRSDVFVRDLRTGATAIVSAGRRGAAADGDSSAPAISADGRFVSFSSDAANLVAGDGNARPDVFLRDLYTGRTELVSVASDGGGQDVALAGGRAQVSDVSRNGRFVVFESDATTLVRRDRNRRTDIFLRDRATRMTRRISLTTTNEEGSGASLLPSITPDGGFVAFSSTADDLVAENAYGLDVFVRDVARNTTVLANVTARGRPRSRERTIPVQPERPAMSEDAATVAFTSSASNLAGGDTNRMRDVFLRRMTPAASATAARRVGLVRGRLLIVFQSTDRAAGPLQCRLDGGPPTLCPLGGLLLPRLGRGSHVLTALAGAPGALYARRPIVIRVQVGKGRPRVRVTNPGDTL